MHEVPPPHLFLAYFQTAVAVDKSGPLGACVFRDGNGSRHSGSHAISDPGLWLWWGQQKQQDFRSRGSCNVMAVAVPMAALSATGAPAGSSVQ